MENFFKGSYKSFLLSFIIIFLGVTLMQFGIRVPNITKAMSFKPLETSKDKKAEEVFSKLKGKNESFVLNDKNKSFYYGDAAPTSFIVVDFDNGNILAEKNSSKPLPIASLTKVMTAVVALDLSGPSETFKVTRNAARQVPTKLGVVAGEKMTLEELLYGALLTSANDAVSVIKEGIDNKYQMPVFIDAMNEKAKFLNLKNSHFQNPQGFDSPKNYSTAEDLAMLSHYALTYYPFIENAVKKDYVFLPASNNHKQFDLYNWNGLLGVYPDVKGVKIGNTTSAENTMIALSERNGKRILVILLGAPGTIERDLWTSRLLDFGFEQTLGLTPVAITNYDLQQKYSTWKYWN